MKLVTIVGARPQFIKAAPMCRVLRRRHREVLVHTGQHYDEAMSDVFFQELDIPAPDYHLAVGSGSHGAQTGQMLMRIEEVLVKERPDGVLIYGDTNSTLAGALAAAKLHIPIAHVEAGLRSYNWTMPEEINRVVADRLSSLLFCPTTGAADNLRKEGITHGVSVVGDVMADGLLNARDRARSQSKIFATCRVEPRRYLLATVHRAENTDHPDRLRGIFQALDQLAGGEEVIVPLHPRTAKALQTVGWKNRNTHVHILPPLGYLDMIQLEDGARMILTDSGGVQKEACWLGVPCVTLRDETEWVDLVEAGWNRVVGANTDRIVDTVRSWKAIPTSLLPGSDGQASLRCVQALESSLLPTL